MIPVKVTKKDSCFMACVASILEVDIDDIPYFNEDELYENDEKINALRFSNYINRLNQTYLHDKNLHIYAVSFIDGMQIPKGYSIRLCQEKDRKVGHAIVTLNGFYCHNPANRREDEYNYLDTFFIFSCLNPVMPFRNMPILNL